MKIQMVRKSKEDFNFYFNEPEKRLTVFFITNLL